jgi:hypothetical protein
LLVHVVRLGRFNTAIRRRAAELGNARFELIEGARSLSMEDQPERSAALIAEFVAASLKEASAPTIR